MKVREPPAPLRLYLVRHGETAWSLTGQHTGTTNIALTKYGEQQARALALPLSGLKFEHVMSSPALRARRTCELAGFASHAACLPDLAEWNYGDYEGKRSCDIRQEWPGWNIYRDGCPGGESVGELAARADRVIAALRTMSGNILMFSHGQFSCSLAARWIGLAVVEAQHLQMDPASVSVLAFNPAHPDTPVIVQWNSVPAMPPAPQI